MFLGEQPPAHCSSVVRERLQAKEREGSHLSACALALAPSEGEGRWPLGDKGPCGVDVLQPETHRDALVG